MSRVTGYPSRVKLTHKKFGQVTGQSVLLRVKNRVRVRYFSGRVRSKNSNLYCHVYSHVAQNYLLNKRGLTQGILNTNASNKRVPLVSIKMH